MKRMIIICVSFLMLMAVPTLMMAQAVAPDVPAVDFFNLNGYFVSLSAMAGIIVPVAAFINTRLKIVDEWPKRLVSWAVSVGLAFLANVINLGIFNGLDWYYVLGYGLLAGLISNGLFSVDFVKALLKTIGWHVKVD